MIACVKPPWLSDITNITPSRTRLLSQRKVSSQVEKFSLSPIRTPRISRFSLRDTGHNQGSAADNPIIIATLEGQRIDKQERIFAIKPALIEGSDASIKANTQRAHRRWR